MARPDRQNNHLQPRRPRPRLYPSHHREQGLKTPGQMGRPLRGDRTSIPSNLPCDTQDRWKKIRTVHVTAMKVWLPPVYDITCLSVEHTECPDLPDYHSDENHPFPEDQDHLSQEQLRFFQRLWDDFPTVTCAKPGRIKLQNTTFESEMPHQCTFDLMPSHIADGMPLRRSFRSPLKKASLSHRMHLRQLPYFLSPKRPWGRSDWCLITTA